jgi:serine/threonine protein kinase
MFSFISWQVLGFAYTGYATVNQRVAMMVCEKLPGISLMEHMKVNWSSMDDLEFRTALLQIMNALTALHRAGLVHRNFHPDCVLIVKRKKADADESDSDEETTTVVDDASLAQGSSLEGSMGASGSLSRGGSMTSKSLPNLQQKSLSQPSVESVDDGATVSSSTSTRKKKDPGVVKLADKPLYLVTDFWFMHNPRKAGCAFSEGRADWGSRLTAPPEASGFLISEKSDIWAFGICVYYWATRGLHLTIQDGAPIDFEAIRKTIPLKWGLWIHSLLKMCLQRNPKYRASAKDIYSFLVIAK